MKDFSILLSHILESIELIELFLKDETYESFYTSREKQDAVTRRLEIIGEVVRNLPKEILDQKPEISWKGIVAMRNLLIHEYFDVSIKQVWLVVVQDLKPLKKAVQELLQAL